MPPTRSYLVEFVRGRNGIPVAFIDGKASFPDKKIPVQRQPKKNEYWRVLIESVSDKGTIYNLRLVEKIHRRKIVSWRWNEKSSPAGDPTCIIVTTDGTPHHFLGKNIPNVVTVGGKYYDNHISNGHNAFYTCLSPQGTKIVSWREHSQEHFPWGSIDSWERLLVFVQQNAPHVDEKSLQDLICGEWPEAAVRFDQQLAQDLYVLATR